MNTTDNNKLIAEFMGYTQPHPEYPSTTYWYKEGKAPLTILSFDTDWNWLMPVLEKIYQTDLYYDKYIEHNSSMILSGKIKISTNINRVYENCVEFIKWYKNESNRN